VQHPVKAHNLEMDD